MMYLREPRIIPSIISFKAGGINKKNITYLTKATNKNYFINLLTLQVI